ncbi:unnamed protein product [Symbiodinium sp. CCMP2592]|nr:unnamed protein product [Symbiodinium sp. CCMP2592]
MYMCKVMTYSLCANTDEKRAVLLAAMNSATVIRQPGCLCFFFLHFSAVSPSTMTEHFLQVTSRHLLRRVHEIVMSALSAASRTAPSIRVAGKAESSDIQELCKHSSCVVVKLLFRHVKAGKRRPSSMHACTHCRPQKPPPKWRASAEKALSDGLKMKSRSTSSDQQTSRGVDDCRSPQMYDEADRKPNFFGLRSTQAKHEQLPSRSRSGRSGVLLESWPCTTMIKRSRSAARTSDRTAESLATPIFSFSKRFSASRSFSIRRPAAALRTKHQVLLLGLVLLQGGSQANLLVSPATFG